MSYYFENTTKVVNESFAQALNNIPFKDTFEKVLLEYLFLPECMQVVVSVLVMKRYHTGM